MVEMLKSNTNGLWKAAVTFVALNGARARKKGSERERGSEGGWKI